MHAQASLSESLGARFARFDPNRLRAMPLRARLWKKIFDLGKTDTATPFAMLAAVIERDFHRPRAIRIEFATCAKTSIP
jgi:hypothetical protein